jgi:hypothetical protein
MASQCSIVKLQLPMGVMLNLICKILTKVLKSGLNKAKMDIITKILQVTSITGTHSTLRAMIPSITVRSKSITMIMLIAIKDIMPKNRRVEFKI